ncbi:WAG22 antigen [Triticum aestivum]|nr:WAG22 antigen-like [Triticum aestivum]
MKFLPSIAVLLLLSCSLAAATVPIGTIERVSKQQILASIPPGGHAGPPVLFLTSPSGKYAAYFVRTHTAPGAGGLGADFCYVEVMAGSGKASEGGAAGGASAWESECRPVSTVNTCTLLFSWHGLEVFDGSEEVWHGETNTDGTNFLQTLELVDDGDMRVRDKDGELAWRASDEPRHGQHCGAPGSPGLAAALPSFAEPIGAHSSNLPFGQVQGGNGHAAELPQAAELGDGVVPGAGAGGLGDGYGIAPAAGGVGGVAPGAGGLGDGYGIAPAAGGVGGVAPGAGGLGDGYGIAPAAGGAGGVGPGAGGLGDGYGIAPTVGGVAAGAGPFGDGYGIAPGAETGAFGGVGDVAGHGEAATAAGGVAGVAGFGSQPLVDNNPYDSGAYKGGRGAHLAAIGAAVFVSAMAVGF